MIFSEKTMPNDDNIANTWGWVSDVKTFIDLNPIEVLNTLEAF